jgi:hypothetical protein
MKTRNYIVGIILFMVLISAFAMIEYREVQYLSAVSVAERSNADKSCEVLANPPIEHVQSLEAILKQMRNEQRMKHKELQSIEFELIYDYYQPPGIGEIRREFNDLYK